ncbi:MAG TPA: hypothetical protein VFT45_04860 [Longimicrobium sp.]|nr:hypothetical protein [Longimicrobium sp.]
MPRIPLLSLIALFTLATPPLRAQTSLAARMQAFMAEIEDRPNTELAAFFPRRGDWTWVQTARDYNHGGRVMGVGIWRFPGAETVRAIGADGPVCDSFEQPQGEFGPWEGLFGMQAMFNRGRWRRVHGNRFVPPDAGADSPVFVEWRREDGQWVVSAFGDEGFYTPRLLGSYPNNFQRDTAVVPEDAAFAPENWFTITIQGWRSPRYGAPRPLDRAALTRVGVLERVSVYVARDETWGTAEVLYLPVAPGLYQPYERPLGRPCDWTP